MTKIFAFIIEIIVNSWILLYTTRCVSMQSNFRIVKLFYKLFLDFNTSPTYTYIFKSYDKMQPGCVISYHEIYAIMISDNDRSRSSHLIMFAYRL